MLQYTTLDHITYYARETRRSVGEKSPRSSSSLHDKQLYTTTNKCLQCLLRIMYTVF